ncbi:hypothetical protein [Curtobacterium sp. MWU13-2055]|uniref:hypothetical protein n=1 Tax=Curtobacterium sp. MWU13-2055 TaxID=2931928 RepID=UPI00200FABCD|nr:hypothetical protein [Curtobacterium sp. MWU13-2055]
MTTRLRRAWRELVRKEAAPAERPHIGPAPGESMWDWAQRGAIDWQLHVEEGELKLELERQRMRARVLAEDSGVSGERSAE